ncbi:DUF4124 domain-containing protein [Thioalkalivibrio sp. XN8]|uniref:DUF4124 domain-containing protein n=1 Tax=Thioalkalivibrio sp. XN8 TaxID=2712863 RepID=UPI0013E9DB5B|nr:DUF4124 domain-containing protein [Thioalkalivibrio sp. XN8]NGP52882.1 DUF4124 domain-containing protein [Thioalkalivibrio sp. XN8]
MRTLLITLLLALAAFGVQAEEVYRTVQPDGTVVYSDRPISAGSVRVQMRSQPGQQGQAPATSGQSGSPPAAGSRGAGNGADMAAARAEQSRLKAEACAEARKALETYENSPRLYEQLPDGGRRYLSDEEVIEARQKARQAVANFCEPESSN